MLARIQSLNLSGTGITTSFQGGTAIAAGRAIRVAVEAQSVTLGSSNSTSFEVKLQCSPDGTNDWTDVKTYDDTDQSAAIAASHTKNTGSSATVGQHLSIPAGYAYVRVAGKYSGGAGKAGESLTAFVRLFNT